VFVRLAALRARVRYRRVGVGVWCCVARVLSVVAAAVADSPYDTSAVVVHVAVAVLHCCRVRADSDCNEMVEVLCAWSVGCAV
jgi:hypothetical protein